MKETVDLVNDLKLFGIKESFEYRVKEAEESSLSHEEFLICLLEDERLYRSNRRCEMLKKRAKFRTSAYLEDFECSPSRGVGKSTLQRFKSLQFVKNRENIIFLGGTGVGKSFLAQAIGHEACAQGLKHFLLRPIVFLKNLN